MLGDEEQTDDTWLKIKKPTPPAVPKIGGLPKVLEPWIDNLALFNEFPELKIKSELRATGNRRELLEDHPEVEAAFEDFKEGRWQDIAYDFAQEVFQYLADRKQYEIVDKFYADLFKTANLFEKFGEEYELIVGLGLLHYKKGPDHHKIYRPILTQKANLRYEHKLGRSQIVLEPLSEAEIQIETEAIKDLEELFPTEPLLEAEKLLGKAIADLESGDIFKIPEEELKKFIERVASDGTYTHTINLPQRVSATPAISYTPSIILRKRNTRSYTAFFEGVIANLEAAEDDLNIPILNDIIYKDPKVAEGGNPHFDEAFANAIADKTIYFPLEYNDEQREIIEKALIHDKVLVQGPPGTGKSHTIANIICHLLAENNKVLVTAYTKRALEVLKEKLPDDFKPLSVNLLGGDSDSVLDLKSSVSTIQDTISRASVSEYKKSILNLEAELEQLKQSLARKNNRLVTLKEDSIREFSINQKYEGKLADIAQTLEKEREQFSWFTDTYASDAPEGLVQKVADFWELHKELDAIGFDNLKRSIPESFQLLTKRQFSDYIKCNQHLEEVDPDKVANYDIPADKKEDLIEMLEEFRKYVEQISSLYLSFKDEVLEDIAKGKFKLWQNKLKDLQEPLDRLKNLEVKDFYRNTDIEYPKGRKLLHLKQDAMKLYQHLKKGNSFEGISFKLNRLFWPSEIKERLYFIKEVKVNGSPCDTTEEFEAVLKDLEIKMDLQELKEAWSKYPEDKLPHQVIGFFDDLCAKLSALLEVLREANKRKQAIEYASAITFNTWNVGDVDEVLFALDYSNIKEKKKKFDSIVKDVLKYLNEEVEHEIRHELISAINNFDKDTYVTLLEEVEGLEEHQEQWDNYKNDKDQIKEQTPSLIGLIEKGAYTQQYQDELGDAILHNHAKNFVEDYSASNPSAVIEGEIRTIELKIKDTISKLASIKSWLGIIETVSKKPALSQSLTRWSQAVSRIGKTGRGKRALRFRKEAQKEMPKCREAVPCWIMPLYKVVETVTPQQGLYDYIIVDEASQLGPDAILLFFLAKKIIIVGDDKQTSPEYVGVSHDTMEPFIKDHLSDIPYSNYYNVDFSFFDHAHAFCRGMTVLREHFRCMPEIIEFSNRHFYAPENKPLYALKQYSQNRLEPLRSVYCENGHVTGSRSNITNRPEAQAIVDKIKELIDDDAYEGKTFGVICLQGNEQAKLIDHLLIQEIGEVAYQERNIVCGNSASFQGDERDIMFLSLVTAHDHNRRALSSDADKRRFNVAASRAKEQMWLFHSVTIDHLGNQEDLRYKLLRHFMDGPREDVIINTPIQQSEEAPPNPFDSWFEVHVYNEIVAKGYSVIPQYSVANGMYFIDLAIVLPNGTKLAVECDGDRWHGPEKYQSDMMRQKVLERCGWQFFRVRGYAFYVDREKAMAPLWELLEKIEKPEEGNFLQVVQEPNTEIVSDLNASLEEPSDDQVDLSSEAKEQSKRKDPMQSQPRQEDPTLFDPLSAFLGSVIEREDRIKEDKPKPVKNANKEEQRDRIGAGSITEIRYFNYFGNGKYKFTHYEHQAKNARKKIKLKSNWEHGFLLLCFENGQINKVAMKALFEKEVGVKNALYLGKPIGLKRILSYKAEGVIGIKYAYQGEVYFKTHSTRLLESRRTLSHLGDKVVHVSFSDIDYRKISKSEQHGVEKLNCNHLTAMGYKIDQAYVKDEIKLLGLDNEMDSSETKGSQNELEPRELVVKQNCEVKLFYKDYHRWVNIKIVERKYSSKKKREGELNYVALDAPVAKAILGKTVGSEVYIGSKNEHVIIESIICD
ncbi:AAA domain-containing protein [Robertkochia sediminum]|uniref:AAA domain-containing protein n=1 Tax=Robertkochia sediminum TaxID=2785326 RepID=UPI001931DEE8|nr:AAA domain-containing protein [Robertkochia sediminum]MBL7471367.1 AAA family ATPase [Robertkochia sediminum]